MKNQKSLNEKLKELEKTLRNLQEENGVSVAAAADCTNCVSKCGSTCFGNCYNVRPPVGMGY